MGYTYALGLVDSDLDLRNALQIHLTSNFYPPIPAEMVDACIDAINAYSEIDYDRLVELPEINGFQVEYKGLTVAPAYAIVEQHRLYPWIDEEEV
jgi:hypothetical protein